MNYNFQRIEAKTGTYYRVYFPSKNYRINVLNNCRTGECKTRYIVQIESLIKETFYDLLDALDALESHHKSKIQLPES